jgi:hypothetical protein
MIANGFVTTLAFLLAVHAVCAFLAGQVAMFAVPASRAGTQAIERIALGTVLTRAAITAIRSPFILRAGCSRADRTNKQPELSKEPADNK